MTTAYDKFERTIEAVAARLSRPAVFAVAFALYAGGGLLAPLAAWFALPAPGSVLVMAIFNFTAALYAGVLLLVWLSLQLRARDRRLLLEWTTNLRLLSAQEFEWYVGELFRREGWLVRETGNQNRADGNIDLELTRNGQKVLVQCKRWTSWQVGVDEVRKLGGTLLRENLPGSAGVLVTLSDFTDQARAEAGRIGIALVGRTDLHLRAEKVRSAESCPICQKPMVIDHSVRGWWFRCVATGCPGKRDLGPEAGAAIHLLTNGMDRN